MNTFETESGIDGFDATAEEEYAEDFVAVHEWKVSESWHKFDLQGVASVRGHWLGWLGSWQFLCLSDSAQADGITAQMAYQPGKSK